METPDAATDRSTEPSPGWSPPAPNESKVAAVVAYMQSQVVSGQIDASGRLPSERSMAQTLKVSRGVVREALAALELAGVVERRTGDGAYLTVDAEDFQQKGPVRVSSGLSLADTLEMRMDLEVSAVALACHRARGSDILRMQAALQAMEEHLEDEDYEQFLQATMDLHVALAKAARSAALCTALIPLTEAARAEQWVLAERFTADMGAQRMEDHAKIVRAIIDKDVAAAVQTMMSHYIDSPLTGGHGGVLQA